MSISVRPTTRGGIVPAGSSRVEPIPYDDAPREPKVTRRVGWMSRFDDSVSHSADGGGWYAAVWSVGPCHRKRYPMTSARLIFSLVLALGMLVLPVTLTGVGGSSGVPKVAISDAVCAGPVCCFQIGDICLRTGEPLYNYRPADGPCWEPR